MTGKSRSKGGKFLEVFLVGLICLPLVVYASSGIVLNLDLDFGDIPSYTSLFNGDLSGAAELHRFRLFAPYFAKFVGSLVQGRLIEGWIAEAEVRHGVSDLSLRIAFWGGNLVACSASIVGLYLFISEFTHSLSKKVLGILMFVLSRGYLFNVSAPVVDTWEIAVLIWSAVLVRKRLYASVFLLQVLSSVIKETCPVYIGLMLAIAIISDKRMAACNRFLLLMICIACMSASVMFEFWYLKAYGGSVNGRLEAESRSTVYSAWMHIVSVLRFIRGDVSGAIVHYISGLFKVASFPLVFLYLASFVLASTPERSETLIQSELYLIIGVIAGVMSGVFGMRFLEFSFVMIPRSLGAISYFGERSQGK